MAIDLKNEIRNLACDQVDTFIKDVMREEQVAYRSRRELLSGMGPRDFESVVGLSYGNNDPLYWANIVDRLNTPFDHVDRIMLQDFTDKMKTLDDSQNWFKATYESSDLFKEYRDENRFFLDSFTYTPFVDYSQTKGTMRTTMAMGRRSSLTRTDRKSPPTSTD